MTTCTVPLTKAPVSLGLPWEWGSVFCIILVNSSSIRSTRVRMQPRTRSGWRMQRRNTLIQGPSLNSTLVSTRPSQLSCQSLPLPDQSCLSSHSLPKCSLQQRCWNVQPRYPSVHWCSPGTSATSLAVKRWRDKIKEWINVVSEEPYTKNHRAWAPNLKTLGIFSWAPPAPTNTTLVLFCCSHLHVCGQVRVVVVERGNDIELDLDNDTLP